VSKLRIMVAGAAVAAGVVLPATAAQASCISLFTTPVDCVKEAVNEAVAVERIECVYYGTYELVCLSQSGS
jgi:hypothetical protein